MKKYDTYTCIYCKAIKSKEEFNREHVIPQSFGKFGSQTMTLLDCVCRSCNQYFADNLENVLGRDSIFGILYRVLGGLLNPSAFSKTIKTNRKRIEALIDDIDHQRVLFDLELRSDRTFSCEVANQVMIMNSTKGNRLTFRLNNDFPHRSRLESLGLRPENKYMNFLLKKDSIFSLREFNRILYCADIKTVLIPSEFDVFLFNNNGPLQFGFITDVVVARALAKVVFNYFAYNFGPANILMQYFDDIRNFIRYGLLSLNELVVIFLRKKSFDMTNIQSSDYENHTIDIFFKNGKIIGEMWLFNQIFIKIILSRNYPIYLKKHLYGSVFDIQKRIIKPRF